MRKATLTLLLSTAGLLGAAGCRHAAPAAPGPAAWKLDESRLTAPIRFQASDLDPAKRPCDDFAGWANDRWLAANPIPGDQTRWGAFDVLRQRSLDVQRQLAERAAAAPAPSGIERIVADLWVSGMDEARIEAKGLAPLRDRLAAVDALGNGPAIAAWLRDVASRGENPLFAFGPEADFKDSSMNIAYALQGGLGLPDKTYYFAADKQPIREAYERHVAKVLALSGVPQAEAEARAKTVLAFETRLAGASKSQEDLSRDVSLYYNPVSPADADGLTPNFPWTAFFASQGIDAPKTFSLAVPSFHAEVSKMLGDVPAAEWRTYLRFHLVDDASPFLGRAFVEENFDFYRKTLAGQKELQPRWKRVLGAIETGAGEAMGQLYVAAAFPPSSRARMETLVANLGQALKARIEALPWMSDATKAKALAKWATFTPKIGYPSKWRDYTGLATARDDYLGNALAARSFNYRWAIGKIGKPVDRTEWGMTPQTVNAYYNPLQNEIVFPAAILQPPFFDPTADDPLNYGAIGAVIGHEMTHGYDDQGARFGPTGLFEQWWTEEDAIRFKARTDQLVRQYDAVEAAPGLKVNGRLTLGENIADLGGLAVAFDAMKRAAAGAPDPKTGGLTREQRLFLGWATVWRAQMTPELLKVRLVSDPHSPPRVRANATPRNIPAFAAAFGCKAGDPMAHGGEDLVVIW